MVSQFLEQRTYYGLSTDTKPATDVRNGDRFVEINTSDEYYYDGEGLQWVKFTKKATTV